MGCSNTLTEHPPVTRTRRPFRSAMIGVVPRSSDMIGDSCNLTQNDMDWRAATSSGLTMRDLREYSLNTSPVRGWERLT